MSDVNSVSPSGSHPHETHDKGPKPGPDHATQAEQERESHEAKEAINAQASNRDRMVDIGRGNQQAGRHNKQS